MRKSYVIQNLTNKAYFVYSSIENGFYTPHFSDAISVASFKSDIESAEDVIKQLLEHDKYNIFIILTVYEK